MFTENTALSGWRFVGAEQSRPIMVPGEIFHYALPGRISHALDDFRMSIQMLQCRRDCIDVSRLNDDSFHAVTNDIAGFARCDDGQTAGGSFINGLRAAFPLRRKNVKRCPG